MPACYAQSLHHNLSLFVETMCNEYPRASAWSSTLEQVDCAGCMGYADCTRCAEYEGCTEYAECADRAGCAGRVDLHDYSKCNCYASSNGPTTTSVVTARGAHTPRREDRAASSTPRASAWSSTRNMRASTCERQHASVNMRASTCERQHATNIGREFHARN